MSLIQQVRSPLLGSPVWCGRFNVKFHCLMYYFSHVCPKLYQYRSWTKTSGQQLIQIKCLEEKKGEVVYKFEMRIVWISLKGYLFIDQLKILNSILNSIIKWTNHEATHVLIEHVSNAAGDTKAAFGWRAK